MRRQCLGNYFDPTRRDKIRPDAEPMWPVNSIEPADDWNVTHANRRPVEGHLIDAIKIGNGGAGPSRETILGYPISDRTIKENVDGKTFESVVARKSLRHINRLRRLAAKFWRNGWGRIITCRPRQRQLSVLFGQANYSSSQRGPIIATHGKFFGRGSFPRHNITWNAIRWTGFSSDVGMSKGMPDELTQNAGSKFPRRAW